MKYSKSGLALTEKFEGCALNAYRDLAGVLTIGYGHVRDVWDCQKCTQEEAEAWLAEDVALAEAHVNAWVKVELTQEEFDSLVDLTFNLGGGAVKGSTLLKKLNAGDYKGAAAEFERWSHAGGKEVAGLLRRRLAEKALFESAQPSAIK